MTVPTIFDTCRPRADVLTGAMTEADFAADLAQVILGEGHAEYLDPARVHSRLVTWLPWSVLKIAGGPYCARAVLPSSSVGEESLSPNHPDTSSRF